MPTLSLIHYGDVIMGAMASQITSLTIVCSTVYSGADQSKHQSASLAFVRGIHRCLWPENGKDSVASSDLRTFIQCTTRRNLIIMYEV